MNELVKTEENERIKIRFKTKAFRKNVKLFKCYLMQQKRRPCKWLLQ